MKYLPSEVEQEELVLMVTPLLEYALNYSTGWVFHFSFLILKNILADVMFINDTGELPFPQILHLCEVMNC